MYLASRHGLCPECPDVLRNMHVAQVFSSADNRIAQIALLDIGVKRIKENPYIGLADEVD